MMPCGIACMPVVLCGMQQVTLCLFGCLLIKSDLCLHLAPASLDGGRRLLLSVYVELGGAKAPRSLSHTSAWHPLVL